MARKQDKPRSARIVLPHDFSTIDVVRKPVGVPGDQITEMVVTPIMPANQMPGMVAYVVVGEGEAQQVYHLRMSYRGAMKLTLAPQRASPDASDEGEPNSPDSPDVTAKPAKATLAIAKEGRANG